MIEGWKYYNHALLPTTEPHEIVDEGNIKKSGFWRGWTGTPLFARWTSDFDMEKETSWWYLIKDTQFDISKLKAKRRYEINKGKKNFTVKRITALDYSEQLLEVQVAAFSAWPEKYRPTVNSEQFIDTLKSWNDAIIYGAFSNEDNQLYAYAYLKEYDGHLEFSVLRANPNSESKGINAAVVAQIVEDYNNRLGRDFYINDGERSIRHETAFQDYLEKYFEFRKAYCKLNIKYRFPINFFVKILYPFKEKIGTDGKIQSLIYSLLKMDEYSRNE